LQNLLTLRSVAKKKTEETRMNFKKIVRNAVLAAFGGAMIAGSAFAAAGDLTAIGANSFVLPIEAVAGAAGTTGSIDAINYEIENDLSVGTVITVTLPAGAIFTAAPVITQVESDNLNTAATVATAPDFTQTAGGIGWNFVKFVVETAAVSALDTAGPGDATSLLIGSDVTASDAVGAGTSTDVAFTTMPTSAASLVTTLEITDAATSYSYDDDVTVAAAINGLDLTFSTTDGTDGNAVIDVTASPSRVNFVAGAPATTTTVFLDITSTLNAAVTDNFDWTATLKGNLAGITAAAYSSDDGTLGLVGTFTVNDNETEAVLTGTQADFNSLESILLTVDGTTQLETGKYSLDVDVEFATPASWNDESYSTTEAFTFDINGYQARVPYFFANSSSFFRVTNNSTVEANVEADVFDESGNVATAVPLGTVAAKSSTLIYGNALQAKIVEAGYTDLVGSRYTVKLTITEDPSLIDIVAFLIVGDANRTIPVVSSNSSAAWKN
jgi:hypothetical protein